MVPNKFYFPSLDGLRFFAFLFIFLFHATEKLPRDGDNLGGIFLTLVNRNGWVGVDLFLVLSGFLITTIILKERIKFSTFSLSNFYIRRSLRIWPLYFLALIAGFIVIPYLMMGKDFFLNPTLMSHLQQNLPLYFVFLGNWSVILHGWGEFDLISHLWTISLEEQFYLIWPVIILLTKNYKKLLVVEVILFLFSVIFRLLLSIYFSDIANIRHLNTFSRLDTFIWGAMFAVFYIYFESAHSFFKKISQNKYVIGVIVILLLSMHGLDLLTTGNIYFDNLSYLYVDLIFTFLIIASIFNNSIYTKFLSSRIISWLGRISYGLYVWHILAIRFSERVFHKFNFDNQILIVTVAFVLTVIISTFTYYFFEKYFLQFKTKFTKVPTKPI